MTNMRDRYPVEREETATGFRLRAKKPPEPVVIPAAERDIDAKICAAASTDWRAGHVEKGNVYCRATHHDRVSDERVVFRANIHFPHEADVKAAAHCRNRLPVYIASMARVEQRIAELSAEVARLKAESADPEPYAFRAGKEAAAAWLERYFKSLEVVADLNPTTEAATMGEVATLREAAKAMRKWIKEGDK